MKGNNTFQFNQATMIEALQFYLDSQFKEKMEVLSVREIKEGQTVIYNVRVKEVDDE